VGISFRILPGLRIGVTRRGFNASVGPRAASIHAGPGGLRYSSSIGPVTVSGGGRRRRYRSGSSRGFDFEAFDAVMRVSPEERVQRLEKEIARLEKRGWKLSKREEFSAFMTRKATEKRKMTWLFIFGALSLLFVGQVIDLSLGISQASAERPFASMLIAAVVFTGCFVSQIYTFAAKKSANRKFEVGEYGVLHKHYHG
jgi:hypothetical protein